MTQTDQPKRVPAADQTCLDASERADRELLAPLPRVLGEVQVCFVHQCLALLACVFSKSKIDLRTRLSAAEGAKAIQALCACEDSITQRFANALGRGFYALVQPADSGVDISPLANARGDLAVVETAVFRHELGLKKTAAEGRSQHASLLDAIAKRLDHLLLQATVTATNSPVEPMSVAQSFILVVAEQPQFTGEIRAVLLEQARPTLLGGLEGCWRAVNTVLLNARILPEEEGGRSNGEREGLSPVEVALDQSPPATSPSPLLPKPIVDRSDLIARCGALFDQINADPGIPAGVKSRLAMLQLPYTTYALGGNSGFLTNQEHPARNLLALLADMGRALQRQRSLESHPAYWSLVDIVEEIRTKKPLDDQAFFDTYCLLLALQ